MRQCRRRRDRAGGGDLRGDEAARIAAVERLAGGAVREHLVALRVARRDDGGEATEVAAEDGGRPERVVGDDAGLDVHALGAVGERGEGRRDAAGERDLRHLGVEEEPRDTETAERGELHLGDERRARREVASADRAEAADRPEPGAHHGGGREAREARARRADHAEVGQVADEGEHVRHHGPDRHVPPALEGEQRLTDGRVDDGEHRARTERVCFLAERVELVGARVARDRLEAFPPRGIVPALRGAELQDEGRRGSGHASTGAPAAAEA